MPVWKWQSQRDLHFNSLYILQTIRKSHFIATAASVLALAPAAFGANSTWDTTATVSSWNINGNWASNVIADGSGNTADFNTVNITADTTVNLAVDRTIGNLVFGDTTPSTAGSWSLATGNPGGRLTLAGTTPTITVNTLGSGKSASVRARIDGTSGFTKAGTGMLILHNAANGISGTVTLSAGTLQLNAAALGSATTIAINSGNLVVATTSANAFGGMLVFGGGLLQFNQVPLTDYSSQFSTAPNQNYRFNIITGISATFGSNLSSSSGSLTKLGSGTLTLNATNSYTGGTAINDGNLSIGNAGALGTTGTISFGGGTLQYKGINSDFSSRFSKAANQAYKIDTNGQNVTSAGALASSGGTLTKSGIGSLTLRGGLANTFSGPIAINHGELSVTDGVSLKNATGTITVATGASFNFSQNYIAGNNLTNALTLSGTGDGTYGVLNLFGNAVATGVITLAADATISHDFNNATIQSSITGTNRNLTLASTVAGQPAFVVNGNISLGAGVLTKTGVNSLSLGGTNTWGALVVETGSVYFSQAAAMGSTNITIKSDGVAALNGTTLADLLTRVTTNSSGAIAFGGSFSSSSANLDLTAHPSLSVGTLVNTSLGGIITPGGGFYRLGGGGGTLNVTSALTGTHGLVVNDTDGGTVILTGNQTYTGTTAVFAGTLRLSGTHSSPITVSSDGTLAPGPSSGIGSLTLTSLLSAAGRLSFRIDRSNSQNADLITAPSLTLSGSLSVTHSGAALQDGDSFKLFDISGSFTLGQVAFSLPTLSPGLIWDCDSLLSSGVIKVAAVTSNVVGDPARPGLLPHQIEAVKLAGFSGATINPGIYQLPDKEFRQASFDLSGWSNFTVNASSVTFIVGKQRTFLLSGCNNVTVTGCTIRARYQSFTQGRVLSKGVNPDGRVYAFWKISDGYPTTFSPRNWFNAVNQNTRTIDLVSGDYYNSTVADQGSNIWKISFASSTTSLAFSEGDWLVSRLPDDAQQDHAVYLLNSSNCTLQSITSQGGGFASIFEIGGGGNHVIDYRVECSPDAPVGGGETPVVSCAADGLHSKESFPGIDIRNCSFTGVLLDDCIAIHGTFSDVISVSGNIVVCDELRKITVGDPVRFSSSSGFFGQATCTAVTKQTDGTYMITLDQALTGLTAGAYASNPKYNGAGFQILDCALGNTRSRAVITKADNGLISGNTITQAGIAINIGPEYYWNESDYCWNVTITGNNITSCRTGINIVGDGAIGNQNLVITKNVIGTMADGHAVAIDDTNGATLSDNSFAAPLVKEAISLKNTQNVTFANNLVDTAVGAKATLGTTATVSGVTGTNNGLLFSGRPYAFTNSLSGLLLASPFNNTVGASAQQFPPCNASGRWILQPDGNGYAKIISAANNLVLGVNSSSMGGAPLVLETDGTGDGQRWTLSPIGTSSIAIVNKLNGLSATVQTTSPTESVKQNTAAPGSGQVWTPAFQDYTYENWRITSGASQDPIADDDRDGLRNLLEYALVSEASTTGSGTSVNFLPLNVEGHTKDYLTLTCRRRVAATDMVFNVEFSADLVAWQPSAVLVNSITNPDGSTTESWRSPGPADNSSGFLRVRVFKTN